MAEVFDCSDSMQLLAAARAARQALGRGELAVLPTDTVYGVAADAFTPEAVDRLLEAKGRGRQSPPPVLIADTATLGALAAHVTPSVRTLAEKFWPGALTIVLEANPSLSWDLGETGGTVALRIPNQPLTLELLRETGPLAVSSANRTGEAAAKTISEAQGMLGDSIAVYLDAGEVSGDGTASTIVDATGLTNDGGQLRVLRDGGVSREALAEALPGVTVVGAEAEAEAYMLPFLLVAAVAALVTAVCSAGVLRLSKRFKLAPEVRERDVHKQPTPRLGGIAMFVGILVALIYAGTQPAFDGVFDDPARLWVLLGACTLIAVVGVLDDLLDLDWMVKLGAQLAAAGLLAWSGIQIVSLPFGDTLIVGSPTVNFVLTVFLMTLVMNAVNFVDGLDGLVAGVAIIANAAFFIYTQLLTAQTGADSSITLAALIAATIVGISAGFLPFNWHRARMFMGDTGALLIGLLMATSTVSVTGQLNPAQLDQKLVLASYIPIILPIAVLAVPLADFTLAVCRRLLAGKSPFEADRKHLHHRLLDMGHSPLQAVMIFYLWTVMVSLACLLVFVTQSFFWSAVVVIVGGVVCMIITLTPLVRVRNWLTQRGLLRLSRASKTEPAEERIPSD